MSRTMKESGIPWIGEIPNDWNLDLICNLYTHRVEKVSDKDYPPLSVTKKGIVPQLETAAKTNDGDNRKLVKSGDFVINSRSDRRGSCGISPTDGSVSLINTVLSPRINMNPRYYNWLFHTESFADEFYKWGYGIVDDLWSTKWQEMKSISIVVPTLVEQQAIADFLDKKCSEIDSLISLQEKFIEELKSYKQSVITEAVTKGLNPDVPMKDSDIDWLDKYPSHWREGKIQYVALLSSGTNLTTELITETGEYPVFGGNGCRGYYSSYNNEGEYVLIGRQGALCGNINLSYGKFWATEHAIVCYPKTNYSVHWFGYLLYSMNLNQYSLASAQPGLSVERIKQLFIPIPPVAEQQSIADYLDKKCEEIDSLISLKQSKIEQLKEYKKSIIFEYVTGKKEVNG